MFEEEPTNAPKFTPAVWAEHELRRLFFEREASRAQWQTLRTWLSDPDRVVDAPTVLAYMDTLVAESCNPSTAK